MIFIMFSRQVAIFVAKHSAMDSDYTWTVKIPVSRIGNFASEEEIICGFKFWLTCNVKQAAVGSMCELKLCYACCDGCENYRLLIDYRVTPKSDHESPGATGDRYSCKPTIPSLNAQFEMIDASSCAKDNSTKGDGRKEHCLTLSRDNLVKFCGKSAENHVCPLEVSVKVRDMLGNVEPRFDVESGGRTFRITVGARSFYVDLAYLTQLDSDYFRDLMESTRSKDLSQHTITDVNVDPGEFADFLDAVCTYRKSVITAKNFHSVLNVASLLQVSKALRACESFLSQYQFIHPIRKLELAVNHGFGLLGASIVKSLCEEQAFDLGHLNALHDYMELNNECLHEQNVDVLEALDVFDDFVVI